MSVSHYVTLCTILFSIGVLGVLLKRNAIIMFMCIELMLNAINLMLVAFSAHSQNPAGQTFVFFIMIIAAAEVAVGLAILVMVFRNVNSIDIEKLQNLKW
ncbi:MAG: NADH-quinone oxidoreductase subunit NuoK [Saprospiraceae bacterium]|nr:NADH-quinone oxidoreductase subunit NuoK [Saprospiraceae bacterium]